ncbi:MAG: alanyl-tRNA editing protein, partial [Candidatus Marsarchaeota archaeon]|nr:alanyl-tRNA editing protein [Candidatus Marsarchaeota archaeon]
CFEAEVIEAKKMDGEIVHLLAPGSCSFSPFDSIHGEIDWPRRHRLMRMHTAGHVLSAVFFRRGVLITGNQLDIDQSRFDFSMEQFDRALIDSVISEASRLCGEGHAVKVYSLPREEALKLPGMVKLAGALPPSLTTLRIVEIEGVDTQADGGTHVRNTREVGTIELARVENKGAKNRRIYFTLKP